VATRVSVELADDIDGSEAAETVSFSVRGVDYEIDLSETNVANLDEALARFVGHARRVSGRRRSGSGRISDGADAKAVRAWAAEQGIEIGPRGRISYAILEQYRLAS
jgi:hypothetical protein